jgi:hypothetical protein
MRSRRTTDSASPGETSRDGDAAPRNRKPHTFGECDEMAGHHGLRHDQSIDPEHEPFSVVSQRCRGEYP